MNSPLVSVMACQRIKSWPLNEHGGRVDLMPLASALTRSFRSDAHFVQYASPISRRLGSAALETLEVTIGCVAFDLDCSAVHGSPQPAPEAWRMAMAERIADLAREHPDPFWYGTRGGLRFVYRIRTPMVLRNLDDADDWKRKYTVAIAYLARRFGLECDRACADWTRLFRCPRATREGSRVPENWPIGGNPKRIGTLTIKAAHEDVECAAAWSKAFRSHRTLDFAPCSGDGFGLLFHLLRARGDLVRARGSNAYVVRCPRERMHTSGRTGDGSTLLYLPAVGHEVGSIHCFHAHCASLSVREWLREFSPTELTAARRAAGIARSA